jgi:predicted transcriptional regulator
MRTTIVLKDETARRIQKLARQEDRKLSNMIQVLVTEALSERERAAHRAEHLDRVLKSLRGLATPEEHRKAARRLRDELDD